MAQIGHGDEILMLLEIEVADGAVGTLTAKRAFGLLDQSWDITGVFNAGKAGEDTGRRDTG